MRQSTSLEEALVAGGGWCSLMDDGGGMEGTLSVEDSPKMSSACWMPFVLLLFPSSTVHLRLIFSHQFPTASSSSNSLGVMLHQEVVAQWSQPLGSDR
jgi:hypothetical protein